MFDFIIQFSPSYCKEPERMRAVSYIFVKSPKGKQCLVIAKKLLSGAAGWISNHSAMMTKWLSCTTHRTAILMWP